MKTESGFSLVELMVAIAIMGIIAVIAIPAYQDYMENARLATMRNNIETIRIMLEERRLDKGEYLQATYNSSSPNAAGGLKARLGWSPETDVDVVNYVVACQIAKSSPSWECARTSGVTVTASDTTTNSSLCVEIGSATCP